MLRQPPSPASPQRVCVGVQRRGKTGTNLPTTNHARTHARKHTRTGSHGTQTVRAAFRGAVKQSWEGGRRGRDRTKVDRCWLRNARSTHGMCVRVAKWATIYKQCKVYSGIFIRRSFSLVLMFPSATRAHTRTRTQHIPCQAGFGCYPLDACWL